MPLLRKTLAWLMVASFAGSLLLATGCTRHPNEEQIKKMEETRAAALSAEQKVESTRQERQRLEGQLSAKKAELEKVKKEKAEVEKRVQNWQGN